MKARKNFQRHEKNVFAPKPWAECLDSLEFGSTGREKREKWSRGRRVCVVPVERYHGTYCLLYFVVLGRFTAAAAAVQQLHVHSGQAYAAASAKQRQQQPQQLTSSSEGRRLEYKGVGIQHEWCLRSQLQLEEQHNTTTWWEHWYGQRWKAQNECVRETPNKLLTRGFTSLSQYTIVAGE